MSRVWVRKIPHSQPQKSYSFCAADNGRFSATPTLHENAAYLGLIIPPTTASSLVFSPGWGEEHSPSTEKPKLLHGWECHSVKSLCHSGHNPNQLSTTDLACQGMCCILQWSNSHRGLLKVSFVSLPQSWNAGEDYALAYFPQLISFPLYCDH